jgi:hypothetical protein
MSTELVPLLTTDGSSQEKLPTYSESRGHIVVSLNIPPPPPYTAAYINPVGQSANHGEYNGNREYPAIQILAFGICMLLGGAILYGFKHGL